MNKTIEIQYKTNDVQEIVKDFDTLFTDFKISKFDPKPGEENFTQFVRAHGLDLDGDHAYAKNKLDGKLYSILFNYFNTIYAVEGGYLIRRSTFLSKMWLHFVLQLNTFGNEYPGVYKNCMKQLRFYVQLQVDEFECKTVNHKSEGGFTVPDAHGGNPDLIGNPKTNYLMFLTADEYSVIKEKYDKVVDGIRSDVEENDRNRKK